MKIKGLYRGEIKNYCICGGEDITLFIKFVYILHRYDSRLTKQYHMIAMVVKYRTIRKYKEIMRKKEKVFLSFLLAAEVALQPVSVSAVEWQNTVGAVEAGIQPASVSASEIPMPEENTENENTEIGNESVSVSENSLQTAENYSAETELVSASNIKVSGVKNGDTTLDMELFARYNSGAMSGEGGSLEIVEYNQANGYAYAVSGIKGAVIAVPVKSAANGETVVELSGTEYDIKTLVEEADSSFAYGDVTSVAVSPDGSKLAAAVQHADYDKAGKIAIFECAADGALSNPKLYDAGVQPDMVVSADGSKAYVTLQEANAIAVLDVSAKNFTGIYSTGYEDYSKVAVDLVEDGEYKPAVYENLLGARMPDGIAIYENAGRTWLLTANEGDAREWGDYCNEAKTKDFTGKNIRVIDDAACAGLPEGKSVMFGGRGFAILEVTEDGLKEVYDSGNDFEAITAEALPDYFNCGI